MNHQSRVEKRNTRRYQAGKLQEPSLKPALLYDVKHNGATVHPVLSGRNLQERGPISKDLGTHGNAQISAIIVMLRCGREGPVWLLLILDASEKSCALMGRRQKKYEVRMAKRLFAMRQMRRFNSRVAQSPHNAT